MDGRRKTILEDSLGKKESILNISIYNLKGPRY